MKIATWNVNSIRSRLPHVLTWLQEKTPDVLAVQETKVVDELFPAAEFSALDYNVIFAGQKGYNGVAIISPHPLESVAEGFADGGTNERSRVQAVRVAGVHIINAYFPQGKAVDSPDFPYKLDFFGRMRKYLDSSFQAEQPLVLVGDFNVAPSVRDVWDAAAMEGRVSFHPREHKAFETLLDWGLVDVFRRFHEEDGRFSWWDYRGGNFWRGIGMRLDLILASRPLAEQATDCDIDLRERRKKKPSDHAPVWAKFGTELDLVEHGH